MGKFSKLVSIFFICLPFIDDNFFFFFFIVKPQEPTVPPYNTFIIKSSIAIFLVYFAFLREPNHIDEMLSRDLFEIMPELELTMLELDIKNLEERGMPVDDLKKKLADLKRLEEEKLKQETSTNQ